MKNAARSLALLVLVLFSLLPLASAQTPVVVELFTSEGCSSCPPADAVLMKLDKQGAGNGIELVLLGEHVDYWNYIGWTDRFSSKQFSQRQSDYSRAFRLDSVYTPQMVIDGDMQGGYNYSEAQQNIAAAAKTPRPAQVSLKWAANNRLHVDVQAPPQSHSTVLLAITEDNLSTSVQAGENNGTVLHHADVVRQLRALGDPQNGHFEAEVDAAPHPDWNQANLKVAVLVQDDASKKILGAGVLPYSH